jgi:hypothetical protein
VMRHHLTWIIHEMKNKKSPLPSIPSHQGRGNIFCIICE